MKTKKKNFFHYVIRYKLALFSTIFFSLTLVAGQVGGTLQIGNFFSETLIKTNFSYVNLSTILLLLVFALMWAGSHYLAFISSNWLAVSVMHDIRNDLYSKLLDMPISYYKRNREGEILSRMLNDTSVIEIFLMNIVVEMVAQPLTVIAIVIILFNMNTRIAIYFFSITPLIGIVLGGLGGLVSALSLKVQKNISGVTSSIQETLYGISVIKGYGVEESVRQGFFQKNKKYLKSSRKELMVRLLGTPVSEFLGVVGVIIILVLGALSVQSGMAEASDMINFLALSLVLSQPLSQASNIFMVLKKLTPASKRLFELIHSEEKENFNGKEIAELKGKITFENVAFGYNPNEPILTNINLKINPGETVAIVGPSGAGKSTLISLITLFNLPNQGKVLLDSDDTRNINPLSIRRRLGLVTQDTILFSGTIRENIRLSKPDATEKEILAAARLANAHEFISKLPEGYETQLGDRGVRLSGGQQQRIVLARAVIRNPKILILDEATSSLDARSEKLISEALTQILGKQTTLIITHKLSTIANADKIIVIEKGQITQVGTHQELLEQSGIYQTLFNIQVNI